MVYNQPIFPAIPGNRRSCEAAGPDYHEFPDLPQKSIEALPAAAAASGIMKRWKYEGGWN